MSAESLDCRKAARLLSQSQERALRDDERKALSLHLSRCISCSNFETQLAFLRKAAAMFAQGGTP